MRLEAFKFWDLVRLILDTLRYSANTILKNASQRTSKGHWAFNTLRPRQNGRHFADDILRCIFLNENVWIPIEISLKFAPKGPIDNNPALFQIMAWRRPGDKPLSEPMMGRLLTHICVTWPQWVNSLFAPDHQNNLCSLYHSAYKYTPRYNTFDRWYAPVRKPVGNPMTEVQLLHEPNSPTTL